MDVSALLRFLSLTEKNYIELGILFTMIFALIIFFWIFYKPYHIIKNPYIIGFGHLSDSVSGRKKNELFIDIMKRRSRSSDSCPVFPNGWIPILASKKLVIGQTISVSVFGQDLAVFRGTEGQAFVVDAYCPHLGANLGVGGKVKDVNCIQCPFHGWKFSGVDGTCTSIPYSDKIPTMAKIRTWATSEKTGFIFVWYHAEGDPPNWEIPEIEEIVRGEWNQKGSNEYTTFCHVQEIPENAADWSHFLQLHTESVLSGSDLRTKNGGIWSPVKHKWIPNWRSGEAPNGHIAFLELKTRLTLFDVDLPILDISLEIKQIGPALVYLRFSNAFMKGAFIQYLTPLAPYQHRLIHAFYCNWKLPSLIGLFFLKGEGIQLERDIMIWNNKRFLKTPIIVKEDNLIAKYRRWFAQFFSQNSPTQKDIEDRRLDW